MSKLFRLDIEKTVQCVAFLLRREHGHRMNYMRLLKVLYIAERECLAESGKPLTGSSVIAMERGPVLEDVLQLIRGTHLESPLWAAFLHCENYHLEMVCDPGLGRLSKFVTGKLAEVAERYEQDDEWAMVSITHELPEWKKNDPGKSSKPIPLVDILDAVGRRADFDKFIQSTRRDNRVADFFAE